MVTNENILNIIIVATDSPSLVVQQGPLAQQLSRMIQVWMRRGGNIIVGRMHLYDSVTPGVVARFWWCVLWAQTIDSLRLESVQPGAADTAM